MTIEHRQVRAGAMVFDVLEAGPRAGPLVLLLHGFPQSSACWRPALTSLGDAGFHAVAPDQRGYTTGARPHGVAAYRLSELTGDVQRMANALGADRYHVIGHDWGGTVAWALAGADDARLQTVTVLSTPHSLALLHALRGMEQQARFSYMAVLQVPRLPEAVFGAAGGVLAERMLMATGLPQKLARRDVEHLRRVGPTGALNWYRALRAQRRERPRPSQVPSLYVWGTGDVAFSRDAAESTQQHVNAAYHFVELDGASHWLPDLHWGDIDDLVRDHLGPARRTPRASTRRRTAPGAPAS